MADKSKTPLLKAVRTVIAASVFVLFVILFLNWGGVFDKIFGWLPKLEFWPAVMAVNVGVLVLILAVSMVFGRWYCSVLCPMGVLQDGVRRIFVAGKKSKRFGGRWTPERRWVRFCLLAAYLILIALGLGSMAYLVEPYSSFGMIMSSVKGVAPLAVIIVSAVTLIIIVLLVWKGGRLWCNTVCPVGTILGIFSRRSLFRPVINEDKCVSCGLCGKGCRASCIDTEHHTVDMSRCTLCFDCLENCSVGAIEYKFQLPRRDEVSTNGRRAFLTAAALTAGSAVLRADGGLAVLEKKQAPSRGTRLVPAGSVSLKAFDSRCIGCQLCVSVCPNKVLRPAVDFDNFMKPVMSYEAGFCRPECTACADVCPTGAITKVTVEEKSSISIGHAVYDPAVCVVNTDGVDCGNCERHCPTGAITMVPADIDDAQSPMIPSVNAEKCIGCGHCEYVCPSRPVSAIHVEGNEVHRVI